MPALQVRDFPDELYEQLKTYAERNRRSIAQQTIVAVEQMLSHGDGCGRGWEEGILNERVRRRKAALERIESRKRAVGAPSSEQLIAMLHEGRESRPWPLVEGMQGEGGGEARW